MQEIRKRVAKEERGTNELREHLLGQQIAAEGDAASQSDRGEVGALGAFGVRPGFERRNGQRNGRANETEEMVVGTDGAQRAAILGAIGAKIEKLDYAREVVGRSSARNAGDFLHFDGKRFLGAGRYQRAAVRNKELQQQDQRTHENHRGHHRGITASEAGARRESLGRR